MGLDVTSRFDDKSNMNVINQSFDLLNLLLRNCAAKDSLACQQKAIAVPNFSMVNQFFYSVHMIQTIEQYFQQYYLKCSALIL